MYAIIEAGAQQIKVSANDIVKIEKIEGEAGAKVEFPVIFYSDKEGNIKSGKELKDIKAQAEIVVQGKYKKIIVYKYKAKKNSRRKQGHRQPFTTVKIVTLGI